MPVAPTTAPPTRAAPRRAACILSALAMFVLLSVVLALSIGSQFVAPAEFFAAVPRLLLGQERDVPTLLLGLRLDRALSAFVVGALLSLSGALMQVLLRNPLADPYVLGLSGGAAAGALLAMVTGATLGVSGEAPATVGAMLGAALALALLFALVRRPLREGTGSGHALGYRLILTGVMIASGFGAVITLILSISPDAQLRGMVFWLLGDLSGVGRYWPAWCVLALALLWAVKQAKPLNLLARGEHFAQLLGVRVARLRVGVLCVAGVATASAVSVAGTIGFVGLVVPHAMRLICGNDQRVLLPASALAGGAALVLADLLARTLIAPTQLPVGVITALVGVPVFLCLLSRSRA